MSSKKLPNNQERMIQIKTGFPKPIDQCLNKTCEYICPVSVKDIFNSIECLCVSMCLCVCVFLERCRRETGKIAGLNLSCRSLIKSTMTL